MTPEQFDKLIEILGNVGSQAYQLAVRQAIFSGYFNAIFSVVWLVVGIALIFVLRYIAKHAKKDHYDEYDTSVVVSVIMVSAFLLVAVIAFCVCISEAYVELANPGWRAIVLMAELVK